MPPQNTVDPIDEHHADLTPTERVVLGRIAHGETDAQIAAHKDITLTAVRSCLTRFRARTGLSGRALDAWAAKHKPCCITAAS